MNWIFVVDDKSNAAKHKVFHIRGIMRAGRRDESVKLHARRKSLYGVRWQCR